MILPEFLEEQPDWDWSLMETDSERINELHSRVRDLQRVVQLQGKAIEALIIALHTRQEVNYPDCVHPETQVYDMPEADGQPFHPAKCTTCFQNVLVLK